MGLLLAVAVAATWVMDGLANACPGLWWMIYVTALMAGFVVGAVAQI